MEIPGVGWFKGRGISGGGEGGVVSMNFFFFQTGLNFHTVVPKVSLFAFCFLSRECKKLNLPNFKHKMNIYVLVRLDILSPLESDHFPK